MIVANVVETRLVYLQGLQVHDPVMGQVRMTIQLKQKRERYFIRFAEISGLELIKERAYSYFKRDIQTFHSKYRKVNIVCVQLFFNYNSLVRCN